MKQVDYDGNYEYFSPISVNCKKEKVNTVDLYPNPTNGELFIKINNESNEINTNMIMLDNLGKVIYNLEVNIKSGYNLYKIDVSNLSRGIYNIKIINFIGNKKFIKN